MDCTLSPLPSSATDPEWRTKAKESIGENEEVVETSIVALRNMILDTKNLKCRTDDIYILRYLRHCKYDIKEAYNMLIKHYKHKSVERGWYINDPESDLGSALEAVNINILEERDDAGRRIVCGRIVPRDSMILTAENLARLLVCVAEYLMEDEDTQMAGVISVIDAAPASWEHFRLCTPHNIRTSVYMIEETFPIEEKERHFINTPPIFNMLYSAVKPFLPERITKTIFVHGNDYSSLHKHIKPSLLPRKYGGTQPDFDLETSRSIILTKAEALKAEAAAGFTSEMNYQS